MSFFEVAGIDGPLINAMCTLEGESVSFVSAVNPNSGLKRGHVEVWLGEVEGQMRESLADQFAKCLREFPAPSPLKLISEWPGQVRKLLFKPLALPLKSFPHFPACTPYPCLLSPPTLP